jgi:hypothetical protein
MCVGVGGGTSGTSGMECKRREYRLGECVEGGFVKCRGSRCARVLARILVQGGSERRLCGTAPALLRFQPCPVPPALEQQHCIPVHHRKYCVAKDMNSLNTSSVNKSIFSQSAQINDTHHHDDVSISPHCVLKLTTYDTTCSQTYPGDVLTRTCAQ